MTPDEQLSLVQRHYALNGAGDYQAAQNLLTDDFLLSIPSYMPFGGAYRGKTGVREAIEKVAKAIKIEKLRFVATTLGPECAVEIVEFTLAGESTQVAELIRFRGNQIFHIQPFYSDPNAFIDAAAKRRL